MTYEANLKAMRDGFLQVGGEDHADSLAVMALQAAVGHLLLSPGAGPRAVAELLLDISGQILERMEQPERPEQMN